MQSIYVVLSYGGHMPLRYPYFGHFHIILSYECIFMKVKLCCQNSKNPRNRHKYPHQFICQILENLLYVLEILAYLEISFDIIMNMLMS